MTAPLVTVIIGTYRREGTIRQALDSVFAQDWPSLQVVVVDDSSDDHTVEILREYGDRIELEILPENSGLPAIPRNIAMRRARGEFIALLDSDDFWLPGKLQRQVEFLRSHPELDWVHGYVQVVDGQGNVTGIRHEKTLPATGDVFRLLVQYCFITTSSVMLRSSLLRRVGYMDESPCFRIGEDYEWFLRLAAASPLGCLPHVLAAYRKSDSGITAGDPAWKTRPRVPEIHLLFWKHKSLWQANAPESSMKSAFLEACLENAQYWRCQGRAGRTLWFCRLGLRQSPLYAPLWNEAFKAAAQSLTRRASAR